MDQASSTTSAAGGGPLDRRSSSQESRSLSRRSTSNVSAGEVSSSRASTQHRQQQQELSDRERALQEAEQVVNSLETPLDGFNLLGVVANPRGGSLHGQSAHGYTSHAAGGTSSSTTHTSISTAAVAPSSAQQHDRTSSFDFTESIHLLENTLHHVTEQIDAINQVFDSWSRQYLGNIYEDYDDSVYLPPTEIIGQLEELPLEMATLKLNTVQQYLTESGELAHQFRQRSRERETWNWGESISPDEPLSSARASGNDASSNDEDDDDERDMQELEAIIPPIFFQTYFDLTDSNTFRELLVGKDDDTNDEAVPLEPAEDLSHLPDALSVPTRNLLKLPPPDHFTGLLDKVELALLKQVRSRSTAFFHETNRFGQLKDWIASLVQEVQRVRGVLDHVQEKSVVAWELIPLLDKQRKDLHVLRDVLEGANDVLRCKSSVGGLLSANDDQSAAEQIQYGRKLLDGTLEEEGAIELGRLQALSTVGDQLSQYESLVVANLGDELVEILLVWNTTSNFKVSEVQPRVHDMVKSLRLCRSLHKTGQLYISRLNDVIRVTVRTTVGEFAEEADASVKAGVTSMTFERFLDCLDMLFEQLMALLKSAVCVDEFCNDQNIRFCDESAQEEEKSATTAAVVSAAELSAKSISELLRLRKEAHSLVTLHEMKRLWDLCNAFTEQLEKLSEYKATGLRSTLLSQAKAFVERKHEANMSALVAALDSERWTQCDVSSERQATLTRLCEGRAVWTTPSKRQSMGSGLSAEGTAASSEKQTDAEVEGVRYKVVWSCLLLVEMVMTNMACAAHFQTLATNVVGKVAELLRLFNSRSTQLVLGAGAMHSAARLKSINAKHLSLVTQCLGMIISILPHVRASLMAQLPAKQHTLLNDLDKIKKEYVEHNEKVLNKFVTIIGGIVEHGLAPRIGNTDFDERAKSDLGVAYGTLQCCVFLDGLSTNTRKMHKVLGALLPPDHLQDVFSRIFAYVDQKVPELFVAASTGAADKPPAFTFPVTDEGKKRMLLEIQVTFENLNGLDGVRPWDFTALAVLERKLEYKLNATKVELPGVQASAGALEDHGEPHNGHGNGVAEHDEKDRVSSDSEAPINDSSDVIAEKNVSQVEIVGSSGGSGEVPFMNGEKEKNDTMSSTENGPAVIESSPPTQENGGGDVGSESGAIEGTGQNGAQETT